MAGGRWASRAGTTWRARSVLALSGIALVLLLAGDVALAHLSLTRSMPAAGAILANTPTEVVLVFDGALDPKSTAKATAPSGAIVTGLPRVEDSQMTLLMVSLERGTYTVTFTAIDAVDKDQIEGSFTFTVTQPTPAPTPSPSLTPVPPTPASTATPIPPSQAPTATPSVPADAFALAAGALALLLLAAWVAARRMRRPGS